MFSLIKYELTGDMPKKPSPEMLEKLYELSKKHDVAHMVGDALKKNSVAMTEELQKKFDKQIMTALFRYEQSRFELERIRALFEAEKIPFIPLKGAVIRELYPEPWMRTSCDIDVLVHESDLDRAIGALSRKLGYKVGKRQPHDVSLTSPGGVHAELHFELVEDDFFSKPAIEILKSAWDHASAVEARFEHEFSNEFFVFYHIAHMAKHFSVGGCGIRPFIDLWLLLRSEKFKSADTALIEEGELRDFYNAAVKLSDVWFSSRPHDEITASMERYLLGSGAYGSTENRVAVGNAKQEKKGAYIRSRIFLPYAMMKKQYPTLKRLPILLPFFHVARWFRIIFDGRFKKGMKELCLSAKADENEEISKLLKDLGI